MYKGLPQAITQREDISTTLTVAPEIDSPRQYWKFVLTGPEPRYALRIESLGDDYSLDVWNTRGTESRSIGLAKNGHFSGQYWAITSWDDGTFGLTNDFTGVEIHLDVYPDATNPLCILAPGNEPCQHWSFTKIKPIV
jgi:hypothetical protein